jgi:hypothetical protein
MTTTIPRGAYLISANGRKTFLFVMCCVGYCVFCFLCLRPLTCVHNVSNVSGFTILDCSFDFVERLFKIIDLINVEFEK